MKKVKGKKLKKVFLGLAHPIVCLLLLLGGRLPCHPGKSANLKHRRLIFSTGSSCSHVTHLSFGMLNYFPQKKRDLVHCNTVACQLHQSRGEMTQAVTHKFTQRLADYMQVDKNCKRDERINTRAWCVFWCDFPATVFWSQPARRPCTPRPRAERPPPTSYWPNAKSRDRWVPAPQNLHTAIGTPPLLGPKICTLFTAFLSE